MNPQKTLLVAAVHTAIAAGYALVAYVCATRGDVTGVLVAVLLAAVALVAAAVACEEPQS